MSMQCAECGKEPIYIKKSGLGKRCYSRIYAQARRNKDTNSGIQRNSSLDLLRMSARECQFASSYLDRGWIYLPGTFLLPDGTRYTVDFWDPKRKAFLEHVGTRQAYEQNRDKYALFRKTYPTVPFVIVNNDNEEVHKEADLPDEPEQ